MNFIDTNVLIYTEDSSDPVKQKKARALLSALLPKRQVAISSQVFSEFARVAVEKLKLPPHRLQAFSKTLRHATFISIVQDHVIEAVALRSLHQLSFWDALILSAAKSADCDVLYSEDFQHGRTYGTVEVLNPFL